MKYEPIPGLFLFEEFITPTEESELINQIDNSLWLSDLSRRVQHYGWKYDYKSRSIDQSMNLGALPVWANKLAEQIHSLGVTPFVSDQVIINEYVKNQSIGKHVDCIPCFKDGISSLSLLEGWEMTFTHSTKGLKEVILLKPRSLMIMTGESRYMWTHEIPKRLTENSGHVRGRRVSLTFRTVIV